MLQNCCEVRMHFIEGKLVREIVAAKGVAAAISLILSIPHIGKIDNEKFDRYGVLTGGEWQSLMKNERLCRLL